MKMGDRANFGFRSGEHTIFLYGHWAGEGMMDTLAQAVNAARPRWNDPAYATRIAITHIVDQNRAELSETGWGLSIDNLCDNEHKVPVVTWERWESPGFVALYHESEAITQPAIGAIYNMSLEAFVGRFMKVRV
jgi:hypothetical protein